MNITIEDILTSIKELTLLEVVDLVKALEEEFGISAAPLPSIVAPSPVQVEEEREEPTEFTLTLESFGDSKIEVIKIIRVVVPGIGLKDAKALVESAPTPVLESVPREDAEAAEAKLKEVGAAVKIEPA